VVVATFFLVVATSFLVVATIKLILATRMKKYPRPCNCCSIPVILKNKTESQSHTRKMSNLKKRAITQTISEQIDDLSKTITELFDKKAIPENSGVEHDTISVLLNVAWIHDSVDVVADICDEKIK